MSYLFGKLLQLIITFIIIYSVTCLIFNIYVCYIRNVVDKDMSDMSAIVSSSVFRPIDIPPITNDIEVDNEIQQIFMLPDFLDVGFCFLNSGITIIFFNYVIGSMHYYIFL